MKNNIKVSIIIPVYNSSEYLRRCFDSCIYQTLQNIEIIAINDCSPNPRDAEIMDEYKQRYPEKFRCIYHHENKRQGGARNTGIVAAKGEYLQFVDSDDYIDFRMCETLYNSIIESNADMSICEYLYLTNGSIIRNYNTFSDIPLQEKSTRLSKPGLHSPCRLMIKKQVITKNGLFFPENLFYEDFAECLWIIAAEKIMYVPDSLYFYVQRYGSTTNPESAEINYKRVYNIFDCVEYVFRSSYFCSLSENLKTSVFIYLFSCFFTAQCHNVVSNFPKKIMEWCARVEEIRKLYSPSLDDAAFERTTEGIHIKYTLKFFENHFGDTDFVEKLASYMNMYSAYTVKKKLSDFLGQSIIIWGAGVRGERLAGFLKATGISFNIVDNNIERVGKNVMGKIVGKWEDYVDTADVIIVSPLYAFEEVKNQINNNSLIILDFKDLL